MINEDVLVQMWQYAHKTNKRSVWNRLVDRLEGAAHLIGEQPIEDMGTLAILTMIAFDRCMEAEND